MNWKTIELAICGAICLILGWGTSTILHECGHLAVAGTLGLPASLGTLTLTTGSVFVEGDMTATEITLVAVAGSITLIAIGLILTRSRSRYVRMIGIVFLCRAWIDALPRMDLDGAMIAGSAGAVIAWGIVIAEILICGGAIFKVMGADQIGRVRVPSSTSGTTRTTKNNTTEG